MANKKYREERIKEEKQRKYLLACGKLTIYPKIALAIAIAIILCFLLNWASVYNKDIRASEVGVSGFNVLFAALTGNYSKAEKIYGDMAIPFYYYAADHCRALGIFTIISFAAFALSSVFTLIAVFGKKHILNVVCACLGAIETISLIICFVVALSMKNAAILSTYCGGNPACSIRSWAIIPAIVSAAYAVICFIATFKFLKIRNLLK
ncbi:MAG: hypothetical protein IJ800_00855 [Clostridia bacterium]|nr:hypothetical protein [Clostridia bacterium]